MRQLQASRCVRAAVLIAACAAMVARAQAQNARGVYTIRVDGSDMRRVAAVEEHAEHSAPRWSHDGKRLAFYAKPLNGGQYHCFTVDADGRNLQEVANSNGMPDWSPDDKQLAFHCYAVGDQPTSIFVQNLDGGGRTLIAAGHSPRWSPDGGKLAYSDRQNVHIRDLITDEEVTLLDSPVAELFNGFDWSPDGKRLAMVVRREEGGKRDLLILDLSGDKPKTRVRFSSGMGGVVSWSPEGKYLTYSDGFKLHVIEVDSQRPPHKIWGQKDRNLNPAWSPDGKRIAFVSEKP